ncbi:hypothetical protein APHNP_0707 [Anaplasma phagocytophilum str. ApNP]|uniref:Uncharacterized protein n=1 Tax=Anaplasma phagocytophilum str. ApNP TaxID=1359153 RepID=A0A0F3NI91_ANAPH|nr:hypothetical protein APHNP_0707 [Anaplasma phagocytophilum str. ApNP]
MRIILNVCQTSGNKLHKPGTFSKSFRDLLNNGVFNAINI